MREVNGVRKRLHGEGEYWVLLYDGTCNLCLRSVETLKRLRLPDTLEMMPLQQADLALLSARLGTPLLAEELLAQMHLLNLSDGQVYRGADAVVRALRLAPRFGWLERAYRLPGLRPAAGLLYRWIAANRYRLFGRRADECESGACRLHRPGGPPGGGATEGGRAGQSSPAQREDSKPSRSRKG